MENSQVETLKEPSQTEPSTFPQHRRRPLRSETFNTLLRILSHCYADSQHSQSVSEGPKLDNGSSELGPDTARDGSLSHIDMVSDELLVQKEPLVDENRDVLVIQNGGFSNTKIHVEIDGNDHNMKRGSKDLAHKENSDLVNSLGNKNHDCCGIDVLTSNLEDQFSVPELHIEEFVEQMKMDKEMSIYDFCDAIDLSLDVDAIFRTSNSSENNNEKSPQVETNVLEEAKDERQHTEMKLEKQVSGSGVANRFSHLTANKEVEEGEISGEFMAFLSEDAVSSEEKTANEVQISDEIVGNEQQIGLKKDTKSIPLSVDTIDNAVKRRETEIRANKRNLVDYSEIFAHGKTVEAVKLDGCCRLETGEAKKQGGGINESYCAAVCPEKMAQVGGASGENATKNQDIASIKKDAGTCNKNKRQGPATKEKRSNKKVCSLQEKSEIVVHGKSESISGNGYMLEAGRNKNQDSVIKESVCPAVCPENLASLGEPSGRNASQKEDAASKKEDSVLEKKKKRVLTKERRAKKKQKERIKRAEKNRKLGVKRLKLQPMVKPKTVTYCRHYLMGRCHEGEKCKFSHDTTPLTKSKPCCHFARHSCMKGDDCPFDHQLSKYPCNNYVSTGSCNRGTDCMFSHESQASEGSSIALNDSRPELTSLSQLDNSSTKKQLNISAPPHEKVNAKSSSIPISPCKSKQQNLVETAPKPSAQTPKGITFLSHGSFSPEVGSSPKADNGVQIGPQMIHSASDVVRDSNEITKRTPAVAPRGINFLSFGKKPPSNDSNRSSPFKRVIGKSPLSNSSMGEKPVSSLKRDDGVKVDNQITADSSNNNKQVNFHDKDNSVPVFGQERNSVHGKFQIPDAIPSSSLPSGPSLDLLADISWSKTTPSSSSLQKALQSTLAFASKFESGVKMGRSIDAPVASTDNKNKEAGSSTNKSMMTSTIWDFLYGHGSKTKQ